MKKLSSVIAFVMLSLAMQAQLGGVGSNINIGHLYGKVVDSSTGRTLGDASVLILSEKYDSSSSKNKAILLQGISSEANGDFSLSDLPVMGKLILKISASGYRPYEQKVNFDVRSGLNGIDMDLGNIKLSTFSTELAAVVVTASRPNMKLDIDKKVFYVDKNIVSAGGTAVDVMKNVPSVQVDIDGSVKLRNAAPQIFIDGRPTTLTLDQIPADAIESVEVMTNPSAKYDASGGNAGILNIVLKKNKKTGYNGSLSAGVDSKGALNGMGNFNLRQDKFNFSTTVFGRQFKNRTEGNTQRLSLGNIPQILTTQQNNISNDGGFLFGRLGVDYFLTNRTTISVAGILVKGKFQPEGNNDIVTDSLFNTGKITRLSNRNYNSTSDFNARGLQLGMKHNFKKAGEEITADLNYFTSDITGNDFYTTRYADAAGNFSTLTQQKSLRDGNNKNLTIQTDYINPLTKSIKIEAGLRAQISQVKNYNLIQFKPGANADFATIPNTLNDYENENNVYAAYATFAQSLGDFGYKVGLRAERSDYTGELLNTNQKFSNNYPVSLFPSVFLSQKLSNKQELQFSYTRRVNRPGFNQLIPFTDYTDTLNISRGNPDLLPQFTNSVEASYSKTLKRGNSLLFSVYYKQSSDLITRFILQEINPISNRLDVINTYINANSAYNAGAEITSVNKFFKWWDMTTNVNVFNSKINTDNIGGLSQDARWSWFGKWNNNFKLPAKFSAQLSVNYQSKTNLPVSSGSTQSAAQGYNKAYWFTDAALKKTFLKGDAASITLGVSDIFRSRKSIQYSENEFLVQDNYQLTNPQRFNLTVAFKFGKFDASLFKRKNAKSQGEGMQGAMDGMSL